MLVPKKRPPDMPAAEIDPLEVMTILPAASITMPPPPPSLEDGFRRVRAVKELSAVTPAPKTYGAIGGAIGGELTCKRYDAMRSK